MTSRSKKILFSGFWFKKIEIIKEIIVSADVIKPWLILKASFADDFNTFHLNEKCRNTIHSDKRKLKSL